MHKDTTHQHRDKSMRFFEYKITERGVFVLVQGAWQRSAVMEIDLKPLLEHEDKQIEAVHIVTGEKLCFASITQAIKKGFLKAKVVRCLNGQQKKHRGYEFSFAGQE